MLKWEEKRAEKLGSNELRHCAHHLLPRHQALASVRMFRQLVFYWRMRPLGEMRTSFPVVTLIPIFV